MSYDLSYYVDTKAGGSKCHTRRFFIIRGSKLIRNQGTETEQVLITHNLFPEEESKNKQTQF